MKFGKYMFKDFKEFQYIQSLATANGIKTSEEFKKFLSENYSDKLVE
ncbi:hypothetical protein [Aliarcobacter butzleri]|nr:hypothetical protein [Aliarcobacter butzleri]